MPVKPIRKSKITRRKSLVKKSGTTAKPNRKSIGTPMPKPKPRPLPKPKPLNKGKKRTL